VAAPPAFLDCAEYRDCRRDHSVAKEQRSSGQSRDQDRALELASDGQRKRSPFALVVCAHDEKDIFYGDDENEGPEQKESTPKIVIS
jgi:hypothetical protein